MTSMLMSTWYATVMRGVVALGLALLCVAHVLATPALRIDAYGAYLLADGIICGLAVIAAAASRHRGRTLSLLALASAAGIGLGIYLLSTPLRTPLMPALVMAAWAVTVGVVALDGGYSLYRSVPGPLHIIALGSGVRRRRGAPTECGMLLAGAVALAFTVLLFALAAAGIAPPLSLVGLFAVSFGYLHLRVGLVLGMLAVAGGDVEEEPMADAAMP